MKPQNVRYFIRALQAPSRLPGVLVDVSAQGVPIIINGLEIRKASRNWSNQVEWEAGYQWLSEQQERMLVDASNRIIAEVRQVRGPKPGQNPAEVYDPEVTPQYNGTQLYDMLYDNDVGINGANTKLDAIRIAVEQLALEGDSEQLDQIILLLGAL